MLFDKFREKNFFKKTNMLSFICLCLFLLDCCITGGGRYFSVFGITPRLFTGGLSVLFALPSLIKDRKRIVRQPLVVFVAIFLIWLIFCAVIGWKAGNNQEVFHADIKGFMYFLLVPVAINCVTDKKRLHSILNIIVIGAFLQSLMIIGINVLCSVNIMYLHKLYYPVYELGFGTVSVVSDSIFRIFTNSAPYLIVASVILFFRQFQNDKCDIRYCVMTTFYMNAILLSYTRSLYGSVGITLIIAIVLSIFLYPKKIRGLAKYIGVTIVCTLILVSAQEVIFEANYFNFAIARTFNTEVRLSYTSTLLSRIRAGKNNVDVGKEDDKQAQEGYLVQTEVSDERREITKKELLDLITESPVVGNGLGACSMTRNGPDEYFYLDVLARMGTIGMLLYLMPYIYMLWLVKRNKKVVISACMVLPFWIATAFNPWMNAAVGISCYSVAISVANKTVAMDPDV